MSVKLIEEVLISFYLRTPPSQGHDLGFVAVGVKEGGGGERECDAVVFGGTFSVSSSCSAR